MGRRKCCCTGTPSVPCSPCAIPGSSLTLTLIGTYNDCTTGNPGTYTLPLAMAYLGSGIWDTGCYNGAPFDCGGGLHNVDFRLTCPGGAAATLTVTVSNWSSPCATTGGSGAGGNYTDTCAAGTTCGASYPGDPQFAGSSHSCSPLNLTFAICPIDLICRALCACFGAPVRPNITWTQVVITP
jgi:hypothetical protein